MAFTKKMSTSQTIQATFRKPLAKKNFRPTYKRTESFESGHDSYSADEDSLLDMDEDFGPVYGDFGSKPTSHHQQGFQESRGSGLKDHGGPTFSCLSERSEMGGGIPQNITQDKAWQANSNAAKKGTEKGTARV